MVVAKPFPSSIRVGIDICHVPRIQKIVQATDASYLERWAGKVFNRLEWPSLTTQLAIYSQKPDEEKRLRLARWLAGRWAIKEAAIKAHSRRRLFLREVSILKEPAQDSDAGDAHFYEVPGKPQVLIDPPTALILMDDHVARLRGLRCVRSPLAPPQFPHASQGSPSPAPPRFSDHQRSPVAVDAGRMHRRRRRVEMRDRRLADASLSHDGDYAVAICQALDEAEAGALDGLTDDGNGPPLHEAEYGDLGFCSEDKPGPPLGHDG